jgi:nicotinate-nucleotide adenylyltransferase
LCGETPQREADAHGGPRYGILGGTFDPPHIGHLMLAQEAFARLHLDRVWFLPAGSPPHKSGRAIAAACDRRALVELAIADDERFALSTVDLDRAGPSYTVDTLRLLRGQWGASAAISFLMGWDMLAYLPQWHDAPGVLARLDQVVAVHRPGFVTPEDEVARLETALPGLRGKLVVLPAPLLDISGSTLRERVATGLPIRYLVPEAVSRYIAERGLYRGHDRPTYGTLRTITHAQTDEEAAQ